MPASKASRFFDRVDRQELMICQTINGYLRFRFVLPYFKIASRLGDGWFWYVLILLMPLLHPEAGLALALLMTTTGLICTLTYKLLKRNLVRERPFISFPVINCATPPLDRYSFPSGHTLHAVCFNTLLALTLPELAWAILPFTLSVAISRVVLGLHYPSDVLAGVVIGGTMGALAASGLPAFKLLTLA